MHAQHIYPTQDIRPHETLATGCWCKPWLRNVCPECMELGDKPWDARRGCFICGGSGMVDAVGDSQPEMVVHHRAGEAMSRGAAGR